MDEERRQPERRSGFDRRRAVGIGVVLAVIGGLVNGTLSVFAYREATETRLVVLEKRAQDQKEVDRAQDEDRQRMKDGQRRDMESIANKLDELKNILLRRGQ